MGLYRKQMEPRQKQTYNKAVYNKVRDERRAAEREAYKGATRCIDTDALTIYDAGLFKRICKARRERTGYQWKDQTSYCSQCHLHGKVDNGFIPTNITVSDGV